MVFWKASNCFLTFEIKLTNDDVIYGIILLWI